MEFHQQSYASIISFKDTATDQMAGWSEFRLSAADLKDGCIGAITSLGRIKGSKIAIHSFLSIIERDNAVSPVEAVMTSHSAGQKGRPLLYSFLYIMSLFELHHVAFYLLVHNSSQNMHKKFYFCVCALAIIVI